MLGGSAEKSHPDVVKGKPAPGQNICCIGYLSEIKTKNRKLKIQGLGKAITDRGGETDTNQNPFLSEKSAFSTRNENPNLLCSLQEDIC